MLMPLNKPYTVTQETFDSLRDHWQNPQHSLKWDCLFVLPGWLKAWWDQFAAHQKACLRALWHQDELIGIAPLMVKDKTARLVGDSTVCDFLDVIVAPGNGRPFFENLISYLKKQDITRLDIGAVREDSAAYRGLVAAARDLGFKVICDPVDVTMELALPGSWDEFLYQLTGKERHEIRRKFRRLNEAARVNLRIIEDPDEVGKAIDTFLALFVRNRTDKSEFMTERRASFFRALAAEMAAARILKLFFLDLDDQPAAAVMCFDYGSTLYLYNNGYDTRHQALSVGLLSKVFTIKDSIRSGKKQYNFLKGAEPYKRRLGGKPVQLYQCRIHIR
jgi:CelD/BcsL family acetyltransferase involved in cellulose biosynthesis